LLKFYLKECLVDYPKIRRDVNAFPLTVDGKSMICFQDSQSLSQGVLIPQNLFARIVSLFDGQHSIRDIQYETMRKYGELVYTDHIEALVQQIDAALLLESPRFHKALETVKGDFKKEARRPPFFSGKSYANDPAELKDQVQSYFLDPGGPGALDRKKKNRELKGIIAPHIDFQRGGHCYAFAYKSLAEAFEADLYVILGIAHAPLEGHFSVTLKDFETPLGVVRTDQAFLKALSERCSEDLFQDEFLHRSEHSIEFQVVFLQSVLGPAMKGRIAPILCGSLDQYFSEERFPEDDVSISQFMDALRSQVAASKKRICFIAGVDLAHVGPQFGDTRPADGFIRSEIKEQDLNALERVANFDADGFFNLVRRDGNGRRICGLPAIYVLLRTMEARRSVILKYDQGPTPDGQSVVSFTAMAFYQ
jgi:AmmeMemoRadiSam system protein B